MKNSPDLNQRPLAAARLVACLLLAGWAGLFFAVPISFGQNPNSIIYSKHNLAISGPGTIRSATEADVCVFCHAPHSASPDGPLWNHQMSTAAYTPYTSSTLKAAVGQPTGSSKLCLSSHDGTVALGMVFSRPTSIAMPAGAVTIPAGRTLVGTDLSAHHPVSFVYNSSLVTANGELRDPNLLVQDVRLDRNGQMQCTSGLPRAESMERIRPCHVHRHLEWFRGKSLAAHDANHRRGQCL